MGLPFIDRTLKTTGIVLLIFLPFGLYRLGVYPALAAFTGGVWGMVNLMFLAMIVRAAIRPEGVNKHRTIMLSIIKFPMLYGSLYCLFLIPRFDLLPLLLGISAPLIVMLLKSLARTVLGLDDTKSQAEHLQGAN